MIFGLAGILTAAAGTAGAQAVAGTADARPLVLLCSGSDTAPTVGAARYGSTYGIGAGYGVQRVPAQLGVMVEKGEVKVRPPPTSVPVFTKKPGVDGWYQLEKAEVTEFLIRGRSPSGRLLNDKLDIDRRTGAVTFADFIGVCRVAATNPNGAQF